MNFYDDEGKIIEFLQGIERSQIYFVNFSLGLYFFFNSIYQENLFENWTNSSGKNMLPPDFFSKKYKHMLEIMRVDDCELGPNAPNVLESKFVKSMETYLRDRGAPSMKESNIQLLYVPDMSKASNNDYRIYVDNFKRIVNKHLEKIESYRNNHPGHKLGFLIFDESSAYIKALDPSDKVMPGEMIQGYPHILFQDKNFMEVFLDKDLDYLIWMTTCKNTAENPRLYPLATVIDLKKFQKGKMELFEYKYEEMKCLEVRKNNT